MRETSERLQDIYVERDLPHLKSFIELLLTKGE